MKTIKYKTRFYFFLSGSWVSSLTRWWSWSLPWTQTPPPSLWPLFVCETLKLLLFAHDLIKRVAINICTEVTSDFSDAQIRTTWEMTRLRRLKECKSLGWQKVVKMLIIKKTTRYKRPLIEKLYWDITMLPFSETRRLSAIKTQVHTHLFLLILCSMFSHFNWSLTERGMQTSVHLSTVSSEHCVYFSSFLSNEQSRKAPFIYLFVCLCIVSLVSFEMRVLASAQLAQWHVHLLSL